MVIGSFMKFALVNYCTLYLDRVRGNSHFSSCVQLPPGVQSSELDIYIVY